MIAWLDGQLVAAPMLDARDRGLMLGDGLFETLLVCAGTARRLDRHVQRLCQGAAVLGFPPLKVAAVHQGVQAVVTAFTRAHGPARAALRITLTRGVGARGLIPPAPGETRSTLLVTASLLAPRAKEVAAIVARQVRRDEASVLTGIKSLNALTGVLAAQEAARAGVAEAVLLNTQGRVAEAMASNVFVCCQGEWWTPPVTEGALPGIARALVVESGLAREKPLRVMDLRQAQAVVLTNSLGCRTVTHLDGQRIGEQGDVNQRAVQALRAVLNEA